MSDEREPRFVEIIDQNDGEGAIKYWCGMLMLDPNAHATYQLLRVGRRIGEIVVMCLKEEFGEPRPSQVCASIVPMIDPPVTPSFPAGHALSAHLMSMLMGAAKRPGIHPDMLTALAKRVAQNRTVAGLHYPLDSEAGLKAAEKVFAMLMSDNPKCQKFYDLLEAAKKESKLPPKKPVNIP